MTISQLAIRKVWKGSGLAGTIFRTSATNLLVMALSTLTSIATARMFGVVGKGEFSAILLWPTLLAGIVSFGLPTSLIYNVKRHPGKESQLIRTGFLFQLPVAAVTGGIAWIFMPAWLAGYPEPVVAAARWYAAGMLPVLLAINLLSALAQSMGRFQVYNGVRLYVPLLNLAGLLALWAAGNLSLTSAAAVFLLTTVAVAAAAAYKLRENLVVGWLRGLRDRMAAKALLGYGSKVFGVELLGTVYAQFDKLVILSMLSARELGLYTVVYALSRVFNVVQTAITSVVFPKVTGQDNGIIISTVGRAFRLTMLLMTLVAVPCMLIGRTLMGMLFGEPFLDASTAFYILSAECIVGGGAWILASAFNAMGRPGLVLIRQMIALAVTVGLFFALVPTFGLNGIAAALLIGAWVRLAVTLLSMRLVFRVKLGALLFQREDFRFLTEAITAKMKRKE
ncbi:oligosaccharide flippase family protein [Paenibacillus sp. PAMC21692]|uniref:oligosaccharide flippase family protein n=1 Tax=Paenibacillus sp. PAMC21692 TaxID=2762320 RepID=UPI0021C2E452|nr:oligosaccharide flippase family protein [Paenibacillus sp. PAMC21692]